MSWRDSGECVGWHLDVVQVASEAPVGVGFSSGRARNACGSCPWVVDQSVDVTLPLKELWTSRCPGHGGYRGVLGAANRFSPRKRVQQRTCEQVEDVPWCPAEDVEAIRLTTCEQVKQRRSGESGTV